MAVSAEVERRAAAVAIAEAALSAARAEAERARAAAAAVPLPAATQDGPITVAELEVWFLARLAGLRAPSCTGPAPLVLDDAFAGLGEEPLGAMLRLVERASESHQVLYVGDDDRVRTWASRLGPGLARVT
jgi:hypothetical protein